MLLVLSLSNKDTKKPFWKKWYKQRIIRIYPIFLISVIYLLCCAYIFRHLIYSINIILNNMSGLKVFTINIIDYIAWSGAHWYITLILCLYSIFPILYSAMKKNFKLTSIIIIIFYIAFVIFFDLFFDFTSFIVVKFFHRNFESLFFYLFTPRFFEFYFGMMFGFWLGSNVEKNKNLLLSNKKIRIISFVGMVIFFFLIIYYFFIDLRRTFMMPFFAIFSIIFVINFLNKKFKINKICKPFGEYSYEIFLLHISLIVLFIGILKIQIGVFSFPLIIISSMLLAFPFYKIEKRINEREKIHPFILIIASSLILYAIIIYIFNLALNKYNIIALLLFAIIIFGVSMFYLQKKTYKISRISYRILKK